MDMAKVRIIFVSILLRINSPEYNLDGFYSSLVLNYKPLTLFIMTYKYIRIT